MTNTGWTEAALLVALPLGAVWCFSHGGRLERGMDAYNNPDFYRQLGKDPDKLIASALELLAKKFSL